MIVEYAGFDQMGCEILGDVVGDVDRVLGLVERSAPIHIKVDTGMGRLGIDEAEVLDFVTQLREKCSNLIIEGIYTHFPLADSDKDFKLFNSAIF